MQEKYFKDLPLLFKIMISLLLPFVIAIVLVVTGVIGVVAFLISLALMAVLLVPASI